MAKETRRKASNFFVWIILVLLIVGLAGFGVSSFGGGVRTLATVGETEIDVEDYARALQAELRTLAQRTGEPVSFAEARAMGIDRRVLQGLLAQAALDEAARQAGLSVGDAAVREQILTIPGFRGIDGQFDREAYEFALEQNGLTVGAFEAQIRDELARNLLQAALASGVAPGPALGEAVFRYVAETRTVSVAPLGEDILSDPVAPPTEAEVRAFYDETPAPFTRPERKAITYVWLTPDMVAPSVEIGAEALRDAFEARAAEFDRPERRLVERLGFPDEAAAEAAAQAIAAGEASFEDYLAERGLATEDVDLGLVTEGDLGAAGEGVFALDDTGVAGPLPSPVGPALYRVNAILSAQQTSFEDAREGLRADLAAARAEAILADEIEALEDLLAGGATLEELAAETEMELGALIWTGAETEGPAGDAAFANAADAVTTDDFPEIAILETGGLFALRLDEVIPADVAPFEDVRDRAAELTAQAKRNAALAERGEAMLEDLRAGASFESLGLAPQVFEAVSRRSIPDGLPAEAARAAFGMVPPEVRLVETAGGPVLLRIEAIAEPPADDPAAQAVTASVTQEAAAGMAQDILTATARAVEAETGITVNDAAVNAVHAQIQ